MPPAATDESSAAAHPLRLHLLGSIELVHEGERVALPRSKKCRALLGYLAVTGREHRRERLCELFWDVADDPRGALRWTLSRLRSVLPEGADVLQADREMVRLRRGALWIDVEVLAPMGANGALGRAPSQTLQELAGLYRGELLEGLELPDFLDFTAWCMAEREAMRRVHCGVLRELTQRFEDAPAEALPWARQLVQVDAFDVAAHQRLLALLLREGFREEAERRYEHALRQFRQVAAPDAQALAHAWAALQPAGGRPRATTTLAPEAGETPDPKGASAHAVPKQANPPQPNSPQTSLGVDAAPAPFVGRTRPLARVRSLLETLHGGDPAAVLIIGEPGAGKSRLLERLRSEAVSLGFEVCGARAFDLTRGRPFGPWLDALGVTSEAIVASAQAGGRTQVFERLCALLRARGADRPGVIVALDDVQWLDRDSAEALHHLLQSRDGGPLLFLLAARAGELSDNPPVQQVIRGLQRDRKLLGLELEPMSREELVALVGVQDGVDIDGILRACAGNPLYALELARGARSGEGGTPKTLVELVRERVARLSDAANDALRWAAVLGYTFDATRLEALCELSQLDLVDALEELERGALLRIDTTRRRERYAFGHDVVREAVYSELSYPRRRLMHRKVALLLRSDTPDPATAHELARHASLSGEVELGVDACLSAARFALRTCANAEAEALAKRGLHQAAELDEPKRVAQSLDLLHVLYSARAPDHDEATARVRALSERALDLGLTRPARIGFQMLSYLRWESASMGDAHENILQAERVSRSADPDERSQALAHAARCLVLLERNLAQAEAFMLEARSVTERSGRANAAVAFALAMIAAHRGEHAVADAAFREAQDLARANGERLAEFGALEHRVMLALDRQDGEAEALAGQLAALARKVRPGAEVAIADALAALAQRILGAGDTQPLRGAVTALRAADAKYELSFVLTRWAMHALAEGALPEAHAVASDALAVAQAIGRSSEIAIAAAVESEARQRRDGTPIAPAPPPEHTPASELDLSATARRLLSTLRRQPRQDA